MEQFLELYEPIYKDLYRLAYYYLGNSQDAEDVVGETVLKAYEKFATLQKKEAFKKWIFKILMNQCMTHLRKKSKNVITNLSEETAFEPQLDDDTITHDLLSVLSDEERKIVVLFVFGGYKGEEIAKILHMKHSTVRSKYRRALKKMEKQRESN